MFKRLILVLLVLAIAMPGKGGAVRAQEKPLYKDQTRSVDERVADLLGRMTLAEKIGQITLVQKESIKTADIASLGIGGLLSGGGGYPKGNNTAEGWAKMVDGFQDQALSSRLGIPLIYGVDAVHGHNNLYGTVIFPQQIGLGAANDPDLVERIGRATALAMIATGIYWDYAPVIAVPQDIRWGRTYESYSENTALVSKLGVALVRGLQGAKLNDPTSVLATPKHYVGDGGTKWGSSTTNDYKLDQGVTDVDEQTLRTIHLPPYEAAIKAGAKSIMVSYSSWNGMKMSAQKYLMTDVLKGELGFSGFLVSDWQAIDAIPGGYEVAVATSINAGLDMIMVPDDYNKFMTTLTKVVNDGRVPQDRIDDAVKRILKVKFEMGLFEHPKSNPSLLSVVGGSEQRALGREAVSKSLVLLQNNKHTLPLAKNTPTIFVAGMGADDIGMQSGGWTIEWQGKLGDSTPGTTILKALQAAVSPDTKITYQANGKFEGKAEVGIVVVGEQPYAEGKGDAADLSLSLRDNRVIDAVRKQVDKLVIVLLSGRPMIIGSALNVSDAFVAAWLPGTEGAGVTDVLFGDKPFTGRLPYTWPRSMRQLPFDFQHLATSGCESPLYPFGFGLDYSTSVTLRDSCTSAALVPAATTSAVTNTDISSKPLLAPPEVTGKAVYIPYPLSIALDGKLEDWAGVPLTTVTRGNMPSKDPAEDGSFTVGVAADEANLYVLMLAKDQNIITGQHGADYWNEDSMEFYVNQTGDLTATSYAKGIYQINIKPLDIGKTDPKALTLSGVNADSAKVTGIVFKTADGWGFEAAIPLNKAPAHGASIGFQAQLNGASDKDRNVKLIWSLADTADNSWKDPSLFGQGIFFKVGSTDTPAPAK